MPIFVHGKDVESHFQTNKGRVRVLATVDIVGSRLNLLHPAVYPAYGNRLDVGVREMLAITRTVIELAGMERFHSVFVDGKRVSGAKPGRPVRIQRTLR